MGAARAAGLRIAADDVGAGNAGLRLLSQMQFDIVKIDLSLVQGGPQQRTSLAVVSSLQELAQRWGAWVIAEGVETPEQLELIRNLGISAAQGYLLGRPGESLDVGNVDLGTLLARDDWLHKLTRSVHPLDDRASPGDIRDGRLGADPSLPRSPSSSDDIQSARTSGAHALERDAARAEERPGQTSLEEEHAREEPNPVPDAARVGGPRGRRV